MTDTLQKIIAEMREAAGKRWADSWADNYRRWADQLDALASLVGAWQPIESAPRDGTRVLLLGSDKRHADGYWKARAGHGCWVWPYVKAEPRKWMPLPRPPNDQVKGDGTRSGPVGP